MYTAFLSWVWALAETNRMPNLREPNGRLIAAGANELMARCPPRFIHGAQIWLRMIWRPAYEAQQRGDLSLAKQVHVPLPPPKTRPAMPHRQIAFRRRLAVVSR